MRILKGVSLASRLCAGNRPSSLPNAQGLRTQQRWTDSWNGEPALRPVPKRQAPVLQTAEAAAPASSSSLLSVSPGGGVGHLDPSGGSPTPHRSYSVLSWWRKPSTVSGTRMLYISMRWVSLYSRPHASICS